MNEMKAVRFDEYGGIDVLQVVDVPTPAPGPGELLVKVRAAGINPGEWKIRAGLLHEMFPATFPSGQGSDLAGIVAAVGDGVGEFKAGDEVIGWVDTRSSHAEYALVKADEATVKPPQLAWEIAGGLFVAGSTAWAMVQAVAPTAGDTVVVSGAAGGVGGIVVQLVAELGATVIGLASERNHAWLRARGATPVTYGDGVAERIRTAAPGGVDALLDTSGDGYVKLGLDLGVAPERIDTIADFDAVSEYGVKADGSQAAASPGTLAALAERIVAGTLELPVAATYPLAQVREAYAELEQGHTRGKIVLIPQ